MPLVRLPFIDAPDELTWARIGLGDGYGDVTLSPDRLTDLGAGRLVEAHTAVWTLPSTIAPATAELEPKLWEPPWRGMLLRTDPVPLHVPAPEVSNRVAGNALLILSAGGDGQLSKADAKRDALDVAFPAPRDAGFWHLRLEDDVILLSEPVTAQPSN